MAYTLEQIQAITMKAQCCAADQAYILLNKERYNMSDIDCARRKLKFINQAINVICRYEPVRGVINATYTMQITTTVPPTQEITLTIAGLLVIDHKIYNGTQSQIASQIANDINEFFNVFIYASYNLHATAYNDIVIISYNDVVGGGRRIELQYNVDDVHVTQQSLIPINVPIPAITETCLTDDNIQSIVEQLNKVCGCCDCQDNADIIKDIN